MTDFPSRNMVSAARGCGRRSAFPHPADRSDDGSRGDGPEQKSHPGAMMRSCWTAGAGVEKPGRAVRHRTVLSPTGLACRRSPGRGSARNFRVEASGVEPLSRRMSIRTTTSVDSLLISPFCPRLSGSSEGYPVLFSSARQEKRRGKAE